MGFVGPAAQGLVREGKLDSRWISEFSAIADVEPSDEETWPPPFFRLQHFVCMYLPMRYAAWSRLNTKRDPETEGQLGNIVATVTERLWAGLCDAAAVGPPKFSPELVRLVIGPGNPLRLTGEERVAWGRRYTNVVRELEGAWRAQSSWPRWETMALHVASFYVPMGLPPGGLFDQGRLTPPQRRLLGDIGPLVHRDALELIGTWFVAAKDLRDEAGIPAVDWNADKSTALFGRTETEFLLLG